MDNRNSGNQQPKRKKQQMTGVNCDICEKELTESELMNGLNCFSCQKKINQNELKMWERSDIDDIID